RPVQPAVGADLGERLVGDRLVELDRHERVLVAAGAVDAHRRQVDALLREDPGDGRDGARLVTGEDDEGVVVAAEGDGEAVDLGDLDASTADGRAAYDGALARALELEDGGVGVRVVAARDVLEGPLEARVLGLVVRMAEAEVAGREADQPAQQRAVRPVALARRGEGAVQQDPHALGRAAHDRPGQEPEAARARGVRRRRAHHDGAQDIEERYHRSVSVSRKSAPRRERSAPVERGAGDVASTPTTSPTRRSPSESTR